MSRRIAVLTTTLGLMLVGLAVPQVALAGDACFHSLDRPAPSTGSTASVSIGDCVFLPTVAHVPVGATVEWRNRSAQAHEVVGANLTWGAHDKLPKTATRSAGRSMSRACMPTAACSIPG